jgi:hypothetical protein
LLAILTSNISCVSLKLYKSKTFIKALFFFMSTPPTPQLYRSLFALVFYVGLKVNNMHTRTSQLKSYQNCKIQPFFHIGLDSLKRGYMSCCGHHHLSNFCWGRLFASPMLSMSVSQGDNSSLHSLSFIIHIPLYVNLTLTKDFLTRGNSHFYKPPPAEYDMNWQKFCGGITSHRIIQHELTKSSAIGTCLNSVQTTQKFESKMYGFEKNLKSFRGPC